MYKLDNRRVTGKGSTKGGESRRKSVSTCGGGPSEGIRVHIQYTVTGNESIREHEGVLS